jgi:hypothetical protein
MTLASSLAEVVGTFVGSLDDSQRALACRSFPDDGERHTWAYWPTERRGVPVSRLDRVQSKALHRVLATVLPVPAFTRAVTIMGLDEVLDRLEAYASDRRHRDDYWLTVFGEAEADAWAVRYEGHHVSLHATVVDGDVHLTPLFLGANPASVHEHGMTVVAPLAVEEQLGFDLFHALTVEQRASAVIADVAPDDIVTRNRPHVGDAVPDEGVPLAALRGVAADTARWLLDVYFGRFPDGARVPEPDGARFAWAGAAEPGAGHYYRIAGPRLLVELDNTQDGANHVHTVVREPSHDFGDDALAEHHRHAHTRNPGEERS